MPEWNEEFSRGMVVVAHPDDAEFSSSGTAAKWCAAGWEVVYVLCTDGSKGTSDRSLTSEDLARIRREEQIEAGKVLGLKDVVFLDHPDAYLQPTLEVRKQITAEIRRHKPDVLITMYPMRNLDGGYGFGHPDHMAAGEAAMAAVFPTARDHLTFPELLEEGLAAAQGTRGLGHRASVPGHLDRRDRHHRHVHRGAASSHVPAFRHRRTDRGVHEAGTA